MTELDDRARRTLEIARAAHEPSLADRARVRAALGARLHAEPLLLDATPASAPPRLARMLDRLLLGLGIGGVAGFAAGFVVADAVAPGAAPSLAVPQPAPSSISAPSAPSALPAADAVPDGGPAPEPTRASPVAVPAVARRPPAARARPMTSASVNPLKAELDGLRRAQELLHQGQPAWAIARLDELDRANVSSALLEERTATRFIAECSLTRSSAAGRQQRAAEFARLHPGSAHIEQVQASCSSVARDGAGATTSAPHKRKSKPADTSDESR